MNNTLTTTSDNSFVMVNIIISAVSAIILAILQIILFFVTHLYRSKCCGGEIKMVHDRKESPT